MSVFRLVATTTSVFIVSCVSGVISNWAIYCHCSNSSVNIECTVISVIIVACLSWNAVNIIAYVIISISVIIGVGNVGGCGWYIRLTTFTLLWLIIFTITLFTDYFKVWHEKMSRNITLQTTNGGHLKK